MLSYRLELPAVILFLIMRKRGQQATCCKFVGQVAGSLPAGTAASPWFMNVLAKAQPVACAGKKHSIIT